MDGILGKLSEELRNEILQRNTFKVNLNLRKFNRKSSASLKIQMIDDVMMLYNELDYMEDAVRKS